MAINTRPVQFHFSWIVSWAAACPIAQPIQPAPRVGHHARPCPASAVTRPARLMVATPAVDAARAVGPAHAESRFWPLKIRQIPRQPITYRPRPLRPQPPRCLAGCRTIPPPCQRVKVYCTALGQEWWVQLLLSLLSLRLDIANPFYGLTNTFSVHSFTF